jgi:hypothetical protein
MVLPMVALALVRLAAGKGVKGGAEPSGHDMTKGVAIDCTDVGVSGVSKVTAGEKPLT